MFKIIEENQNDLDRIKIENINSGEHISIIPAFGANVNEIVLKNSDRLFDLIDGYSTQQEFKENKYFKSSHLVPFPNRIKEGKYTFNEIEYQLNKNYKNENNAAHGFIYDKPFEIIGKTIKKNRASVILELHYDGSIQGYPFPLKIQYEYVLFSENEFECSTVVKNISDSDIPFACGWHPYLKMSTKVNNLKIKFFPEYEILLGPNAIPTGLTKEYENKNNFIRIGKSQLDSCFKLSESSNIHTTEIFDEDKNIKIAVWQETGIAKYNYLQFYIPPCRDSIAIEPMTASINAFNNHDGLIVLGEGKNFSSKIGVKLS